MFHVLDLADGSVHKRHIDQITISSQRHTPSESELPLVPEPVAQAPKIITPDEAVVPALDPSDLDDSVASPPSAVSHSASPKPPGSPVSETPKLRRSGRIRKPPDRFGDLI